MKKLTTRIEPLEPRIAPATISIVGKSATWTDHDGDLVTMKWTSTDAPTFTTMDKGAGLLVSRIFLEAAKHEGASFTVTVKAGGAFGDGRVELGHLDGSGVALKSWSGAKAAIAEVDLGKAFNQVGIGTFISGGIGQTKSSAFTGSMGNGQSRIAGTTSLVKINGDIGYGGLFFQGDGMAHGSITITGSLRGDLAGGDGFDGRVGIFGGGKSVTVGGSITNTAIQQQSGGSFKTVTIAGDIVSTIGNFADGSYASVQKLTIGGSIIGASFGAADGALKSAFVGGSLVAREDVQLSGTLNVVSLQVPVKNITVKGGVYGSEFMDWKGTGGANYAAGAVTVSGDVRTITVGGSIHGGRIANSDPAVNGGIHVTGNIGTLNIGGGVYGYDNDPVFILAGGHAPAAGNFNAIGKLSIKGDAIHAYIAAGTKLVDNSNGSPLTFVTFNDDASIGSILVGKNFVNSNVFAGVDDGGSLGVNPINIADTLAVGDPALTAKLGPVVIKGHLLSERDSTYYAGFTADVIASITVNGRKVFTAGDGLRNFDDFITAKEL